MAARGSICPEKLPPTPQAAEQHTLRAFLQVSDWMSLKTKSQDPSRYGWILRNAVYEPVGFEGPVAPEGLPKVNCM